MKKRKHIFTAILLTGLIFLQACDPNKELYEKMDAGRKPHSENVEYTLVDADYNRFGGFIAEYKAFSDSFPAMDYVPEILASRYVTLDLNSSAMVTFNHLLLHPTWWDAGFGYEFQPKDYAFLGLDNTFTPDNPAWQLIPLWLNREYPDAEEGDEVHIIYNFTEAGETHLNQDNYGYDGEQWELLETKENLPYIGYELTPEDYEWFGGSVAQFNNFSESDPPENFLPVFLKHKFPNIPIGGEKVLKYRYFNGSQVVNNIDKFVFDGVIWEALPYIVEKTEQYIFGDEGWAFDPTVFFTLDRDDYMYLVSIDPVGQQEFPHADFAYYYGASGFFRNFDIRIIGRRLDKLENGEYADPELGEIFENEGPEAVMEEMMRRIKHEGIIYLLQHKYPDAAPQIGGIDVHFFVGFQTFADNWVRRFPEAEYICVAAGDPPQFEMVNFIENTE